MRPIGSKVLLKLDKAIEEINGIYLPDGCKVHGWRANVEDIGVLVRNGLQVGDSVMVLKSYTTVIDRKTDIAITDSKLVLAVVNEKQCIIPINKFVLIRPDEKVAEIGGIFLPEYKVNQQGGSGTVIRIGGDTDNEIAAGDTIHFPKQTAVICKERDQVLNIVHESDIIMVVSNG